jgi:hypothetical protein
MRQLSYFQRERWKECGFQFLSYTPDMAHNLSDCLA